MKDENIEDEEWCDAFEKGRKAGYEKRKKEIKMTTVSLVEMCQTHREFGRKEVVDWVEKTLKPFFPSTEMKWQEQKKEWGL